MRSVTHLLAIIGGIAIGLGIAWSSSRTIPQAIDSLPVSKSPESLATSPEPSLPKAEAPVSISPPSPAEGKQAASYRVIPLKIDGSAGELEWCRALQTKIGGELEYRVDHGRVDLLTEDYAIEVDWIDKWYEGIGQSLHYAHQTGKAPVLAIALKEKRGVFVGDREECQYVAELCAKHGIAVWVLHVKP